MKIIRPHQTWRILTMGSAEGLCLQRLALKHGYRVTGICHEIGCSDRHLRQVFLRDIGLPPKAWLRQERMVVARRKLAGGRPPKEVAMDIGFSSMSNFCRDFIGCYGIPPMQFQQERRERPRGMIFECL